MIFLVSSDNRQYGTLRVERFVLAAPVIDNDRGPQIHLETFARKAPVRTFSQDWRYMRTGLDMCDSRWRE
jgi:hypothetical protein